MNIEEIYNELNFVRAQHELFKKRTADLSNGNWKKNVSEDFDKLTFHGAYERIVKELNYLIRNKYDAEIYENDK